MTFSYKQKIQLIPRRFNLLSLFTLVVLLALYFFINLSFSSFKPENVSEISSLTDEKNFEIYFDQFNYPTENNNKALPLEVNPTEYFEEENVQEKLESTPKDKNTDRESFSEEIDNLNIANVDQLSASQEKKLLEELAYELNRSFNKAKYYSPQSKKEKLEGESTLLVKISANGEILSIRRQDNLSGCLSEDLDYSIKKLKNNWRGKNKSKKEVTLQMKVTYKLI